MLSIATVKVEARNGYVLVKVSLENKGASVIGPGTMLARQTLIGGAVRLVEFNNFTSIQPGRTATVSQLLSAMKELQFTGYRQIDGEIVPFSGGMVKRLPFLRSVALTTARVRDEIRLRCTSIVAYLKELDAAARVRLDLHRRVNHAAEASSGHWRSIHAEFSRWRREVLLPRIRSTCARFNALRESAWLRLAEAKQKRPHRDQAERQAWESLDAEIIRSWNEVLLPRIRSIGARLNTLRENAWLRLAEAKQKRQHRDQLERQAWESVDAEIMRWWDEVVLARIRLYRRPN